jgi:hypothetical protein
MAAACHHAEPSGTERARFGAFTREMGIGAETMLKRDELSDPNSCLNRAKDDEQVFVLLGRDPATPKAIYAWCQERIALGKNAWDDPQIEEALKCAFRLKHQIRAGSSTGRASAP